MDTIFLQGRQITDSDLNYIRQMRLEHPQWSRRQLADQLVTRWRWCNNAGRPKDMAARSLLNKLHARGLIDLPPPRTRNGNRQRGARAHSQPDLLPWQPEAITAALSDLQPLHLELVDGLAQRRRAASLLRQHHYQGFSGAVGENVQYLIGDARGRELAVMVFGAAAWKTACRDHYIGWSPLQRRQSLQWIANQQRFLILPWVRVAHLASHMLALALRRLSQDWRKRYGHPVWLVETFVQDDRFTGAAYRAAGWIRLGQTAGRTRQDRHHSIVEPVKSVWVKPLHRNFRQHLCPLCV